MTPPQGIDLPRFAAISADLAEGDRPFAEVLASQNVTDAEWLDATLFWGRLLSEHAEGFSDAFARAQDAKRELVQLSVAEWYGLQQAIDLLGLSRALAQRTLSFADYSRLIRHWATEIATNADVRRELTDLGRRDEGV